MKKALFIGIFSLLALAPFRCALAQAGSDPPAVKAVEKSSAGVGSMTDQRKSQDPGPEAAGVHATATNQTILPTSADSTEATSKASPNVVSEAQRNYDAGVALYDSGQLGEAISAFKGTIKLKPNDPQSHYMLGMVYWKAKAFNNAVDFFKRAVRLRPNWAEAHFRLGLTYYVLGRNNQTNEQYKKLLELNSPLAEKLHRVNVNGNPTDVVENLKAAPAASTRKQIKVLPVSTPAVVAPLNEKPQATASESHNSSKVASSNRPIPTVAPPHQRTSPGVTESNNAPTTAVSSDTATATAPVMRTGNGEPSTGNKLVATDDSALTDSYKIGVGDVLDIRLLNSIAGNRSTLYSVIEGGLIDFPIAGGPIAVAGLTTKDIQARITSKLKVLAMDGGTQVAVGVRQYGSHTVMITGLVSNPGTKILRREAIPLYVLLAEVQPRLDAARATIMRSGAPSQTLDLSDSAALNFIVRPGDVINLTARPPDFYYIAGRVSYPGQKPFQPGITLLQAILAAGGLARDSVVEISREGADGLLTTTKLKLKEIKSGKIQDPKLQPGDRIEVFH